MKLIITQHKLLVLLLLGFLSISTSSAQDDLLHDIGSFADRWNARVYLGKTQYYGDMSHDDKLEKLRAEAKLSGGFSLTKEFNSFFAVTNDIFLTRLRSKKGANNEPYPTLMYLSGMYFDVSVQVRFDLVDLFSFYDMNNKFSIYLYGGVGYGLWKTQVENVNSLSPNQGEIVVNPEGKFEDGIVFPIALALNYRFYKRLSIFIEGQVRTIPNDKLDNWVDNWATDQLFVGNIGVSYNFDFIKYHGPRIPKRTRKTQDYRKVIYKKKYK